MSSRRRSIAVVWAAATALILASAALRSDDQPKAEKHILAFKFRPNQVLRYEVVNDAEITTNAKEETEIQRNSTKTKRHMRVGAIDGKTGAADLELSIDWVYMRAIWDKRNGTTPVPIEFQSDDPEKQPPQFKHILATVGKPWATIRYSPTGHPEKVVSTAVQPKEGKGVVASETGADGALEAQLIVLPKHPVTVGDSWSEQFDVVTRDGARNLTKVAIQRSYKLTDVKNGRAAIEMKTAVLTPVNDPAVSSQLLLREVAGQIVFDVERGVILSKEWSVENLVVNALGPNSSMKGKARYTEKLVGEGDLPERTVRLDATSKK
ncbi:MAG: hypothetical protein HY290_01060 [Planctomycetia bacterium]|nr:hypothetical protein [Planctomycetia bacterium]